MKKEFINYGPIPPTEIEEKCCPYCYSQDIKTDLVLMRYHCDQCEITFTDHDFKLRNDPSYPHPGAIHDSN